MGFAALNPSYRPRSSRVATSAAAVHQSFILGELEAASGGGGGAVVPPSAEFDAALDDPEIEAMDEAAIAALLAKIPQARPRPLAILDDVIGDASGHGARAAHTFEISQCEMPARNPTSPDTAMIAQRTPRACNRMACISSTLADMRSSSSSMWETFCSSTARRSLESRAGPMAGS